MKRLVALFVVASFVTVVPADAGSAAQTVGAIRKASDGKIAWLLRYENTTGSSNTKFSFGTEKTDFPVVGDWNG